MRISEVFGYSVADFSNEAIQSRKDRHCPFRQAPCTKSSITDPIGVCTLSDGDEAASLCPVRFLERDVALKEAAKLAFGPSANFGVFPEIRILNVPGAEGKRDRKIGKVDFLLGLIEKDQVVDFAAVEFQAVYFSGGEIRTPMKHFIATGQLEDADRRPDFRSSAQKRLVPQLQLKVPVFRRWGKKFFVVTDTQFFRALPQFNATNAFSSEVTWLAFPIKNLGQSYSMQQPEIIYSQWDDVQTALREGEPPDPQDILNELQLKLSLPPSRRPRILSGLEG